MPVSFRSLQDEIEATTSNIVGLCPACNRVVFVAVNHPRVIDAAMRREIAELAISGRTIKDLPIEEVRKLSFGCKCPKP